jgi:hypothetical protein
VHHDADGATDVEAFLFRFELGDQAARQEAVADRGLVVGACAAERFARERDAADRVAGATRRRVVRIDDAADIDGPVVTLQADCAGTAGKERGA